MTKSITDVLAIILNYQTASRTANLYKSVGNDCPAIRRLVINSKSDSFEETRLRQAVSPDDLILLSRNGGYAFGNNVGLRVAKDEGYRYALILNPDIRLEPLAIERLRNVMEIDSLLFAAGPRITSSHEDGLIYSDGGCLSPLRGMRAFHRRTGYRASRFPRAEVLPSDYVNGSAMMVRLDCLETVGYLDERFFLYYEETEWCLRARRAGYKCVINTAACATHERSDHGATYQYYMRRNRLWLSRLYGNRTCVLYAVIASLLQALWALRHPNKWRSIATARVRGIWDGIRGPEEEMSC